MKYNNMKSLSLYILIIICTILSDSYYSSASQELSRRAINPVFTAERNNWEHKGIGSPFVLFDGLYKMWYSATDKNNRKRIGLAISSDGITWKRYSSNHCSTNSAGNGCVLDVGEEGSWDAEHVYGMSVIIDPAAPPVSEYKMWYTGTGNAASLKKGRWKTGYAFSSNGITWTKFKGNICKSESGSQGCVLDTGAPGSWDEIVAAAPTVIIDLDASPSERFKMWYEGCMYSDTPPEHVCRIGYATSPDGMNWKRYEGNRCSEFPHGDGCVFDINITGKWDDLRVVHPVVIKTGHNYEMWYAGQSNVDNNFRIGYALSSDGIRWKRYKGNNCLTRPLGDGCIVDIDTSGPDRNVSDPAAVNINGTLMIWYKTGTSHFKLVQSNPHK